MKQKYDVKKLSLQKLFDLNLKKKVLVYDTDPLKYRFKYFRIVNEKYTWGGIESDGLREHKLTIFGFWDDWVHPLRIGKTPIIGKRSRDFVRKYMASGRWWGYDAGRRLYKSHKNIVFDPAKQYFELRDDLIKTREYREWYGRLRERAGFYLEKVRTGRDGFSRIHKRKVLTEVLGTYMWIPFRHTSRWGENIIDLNWQLPKYKRYFFRHRQRYLLHNPKNVTTITPYSEHEYKHSARTHFGVFWLNQDPLTVLYYIRFGRFSEVVDFTYKWKWDIKDRGTNVKLLFRWFYYKNYVETKEKRAEISDRYEVWWKAFSVIVKSGIQEAKHNRWVRRVLRKAYLVEKENWSDERAVAESTKKRLQYKKEAISRSYLNPDADLIKNPFTFFTLHWLKSRNLLIFYPKIHLASLHPGPNMVETRKRSGILFGESVWYNPINAVKDLALYSSIIWKFNYILSQLYTGYLRISIMKRVIEGMRGCFWDRRIQRTRIDFLKIRRPVHHVLRYLGNERRKAKILKWRWNYLESTYDLLRAGPDPQQTFKREIIWFFNSVGFFFGQDRPTFGIFTYVISYDMESIEKYFFVEEKSDLYEDMDIHVIEKFFAQMGIYLNIDSTDQLYISELAYLSDLFMEIPPMELENPKYYKFSAVSHFFQLHKLGYYYKSYIGISGLVLKDLRLLECEPSGRIHRLVKKNYTNRFNYMCKWMKTSGAYDKSLDKYINMLINVNENILSVKRLGNVNYGLCNNLVDFNENIYAFSAFIFEKFTISDVRYQTPVNSYAGISYVNINWVLTESAQENFVNEENVSDDSKLCQFGGKILNNVLEPSVNKVSIIIQSHQEFMYHPITSELGTVSVYSFRYFVNEFLFKYLKNFVNYLITNGKKISAEYMWYDAFFFLKKATKKAHLKLRSFNFFVMIVGAILNLEPTILLLPRKQGGQILWLGAPLWNEWKRTQVVLKWLVLDYKRNSKRGIVTPKQMERIIIDSYNGVGVAIQRKKAIYDISDQNKAFYFLLRPRRKKKRRRKRFLTMYGEVK